jgi:hypothetical protein
LLQIRLRRHEISDDEVPNVNRVERTEKKTNFHILT